MSRAVIVVRTDADRLKIISWAKQLQRGDRVEFKRAKRTLPQNARMWAMLTEVSEQAEHMGRKYTPEQWKCLFMHALGQEMEFLPALDGRTFIPIGHRSSDLSIEEMGNLIELLFVYGAEHGIVYKDYGQFGDWPDADGIFKEGESRSLSEGVGKMRDLRRKAGIEEA